MKTLAFIFISVLLFSCSNPDALISVSKKDVYVNENITLTNISTDGKTCKWVLPDGRTFENMNSITVSFDHTQTAVVYLYVYSSNGKREDYTGVTVNVHSQNERYSGDYYCTGGCEITCSHSHHMSVISDMNGISMPNDSVLVRGFRSAQNSAQSFSNIKGYVKNDTLYILTTARDFNGNPADINAMGFLSNDTLKFEYTIDDMSYGGMVYGHYYCNEGTCIKD